MTPRHQPWAWHAIALAAATLMTQAHAQDAKADPKAPAAASAASAPAKPEAKPDPSGLKSFDDVAKGFKAEQGYFTVWRKDEKLLLEIPLDRLGKPFLFSVNVNSSVGERGMYASQMLSEGQYELRRIGNVIQMIAPNLQYRTPQDKSLEPAIREAFSESLLAALPVMSLPHPDRKTVLVDGAFLLGDLGGYSTLVEMVTRSGYGLDRNNSSFEKVSNGDKLTAINVRQHFAMPRVPAPPMMPSPMYIPPLSATPDPRSFFVGLTYSFLPLPETPMAARRADPRVGHFTTAFTDLSEVKNPNQRVHFVNRWRLEKKDPAAALSEPVKPIVFWMDKNIPLRYRKAVEEGILEWNKAFEKVGFKNAVQARQQPDDATWDNMDAGHASIRWFLGADVGFAIGPSWTDPRTGEIMDADIGMSDVFARGARRQITELVAPRASTAFTEEAPAPVARAPLSRHQHGDSCSYMHDAAAQMHFAMDLMEARGDLAPDSPEAEAFVHEVIRDTIMHEVGHTLGLRHNFKASTVITPEQLQDPAFVAKHGVTGSVMDYNALNLPAKGERRTALNPQSLGAYDYWAIEYAYRPFEAQDEAKGLAQIASRSTEPMLAFNTDEDADNYDPTVNRFDLSSDPLAFAKKQVQLARELWARVQARKPQAGDDLGRALRVIGNGFQLVTRATPLAVRYVGGVEQVRDLPGTTERPTYRAIEAAKQRDALKFLQKSIFSVDAFRFQPEFLARVTPDYLDRRAPGLPNVANIVLNLQTSTMDRLLSPSVATRLLTVPAISKPGEPAVSLHEVYRSLHDSVWTELGQGGDIDPMRRNLQREHVKRLVTALTRVSLPMPADAISLLRLDAVRLVGQLKAAQGKGNIETQAHVAESLALLQEALKAGLSKS